jgi:hypothetical protein
MSDRLSRKDIDERIKEIKMFQAGGVFVERQEGAYTVSTFSGNRYYDTIREVLSFLDGYYLAVLLESDKKRGKK